MQGSVINRIQEASQQPEPYVGMPVTITHYSDRSVGIVIGVKIAKSGVNKGRATTLQVAPVKATRVDDRGMSDWQTYEYGGEPVNTEVGSWSDQGRVWTLRPFRGGFRWAQRGSSVKYSPGLCLGFWDAHYDYSF